MKRQANRVSCIIMDKAHKKTLQKNRVQLMEEMKAEEVLPHLVARQIFTPTEQEHFEEMKGPSSRNTAILNDIVRKGPKAFQALAEALFESNLRHLAELLIPDITEDKIHDISWYDYSNEKKTPDKPPVQISVTEGAGDKKLPTQVSEDGNVSSTKHVQPQSGIKPMEYGTSQPTQPAEWPVKTAEEVLKMKVSKGSYSSDMTDNSQNYQMKRKPRGRALIVNNRDFRSMPLRTGTDVDARQLESLFDNLGFSVESITNMKYDDFNMKINDYSKMNHSQYDCFIFAVLTHGINGALYTVDERLVQVDDILKCFSGEGCPTLTGKPKIFFIQACRGEMFDQGVEATDSPDGSSVDPCLQSLNKVGDADNGNELVEKMLKVEIEVVDEPDAWVKQQSKLPSHSDMLVAYATVPGYVSWRNSERGSWFVQALTETIKECARDEDLLSMMTMVNNKVARAFESSSGRNKQMPAPVTMLTKKLFFFPGY
ncbi:caspase-3-like isoform X3 [Anneissia japonica]|uniref:caspase-3-like isoform X3 n=1 Tax=Anneissia japonica TaxID=1529436 RepID=UPI00142584C3|nr:caspase-3-like isoform X3 [Anneissia japonica]